MGILAWYYKEEFWTAGKTTVAQCSFHGRTPHLAYWQRSAPELPAEGIVECIPCLEIEAEFEGWAAEVLAQAAEGKPSPLWQTQAALALAA